MTLQELIELAILDAMGLLDEEERLAFEVAFRASAPAVQAQVRRERREGRRRQAAVEPLPLPEQAVDRLVHRRFSSGRAYTKPMRSIPARRTTSTTRMTWP